MFVRNAVGDYRLKKANMAASMDAVTFLSADIPNRFRKYKLDSVRKIAAFLIRRIKESRKYVENRR